MRKMTIKVFFVMLLLLQITATVAFAAVRTSDWTAGGNYPNIYYQVVNQYGGNEWDGVRFANQNPNRVKIYVSFFYRPTKAKVSEQVIYLEGGNTYSNILQLGPNVWFAFSAEKE